MRVLLVVDPQNDFTPNGALPVPDGDKIVPYVNERIKSGEYDLKIVSVEKHPRDHKSFASQHPGKQPIIDSVIIEGIKQQLWRDHCVDGTWGAQFIPGLVTDSFDLTIVKGTDPQFHSFSPFWNVPGRVPTELATFIKEEALARGENPDRVTIDVVGLALDYCVRDAAIDATSFGFKTRLLLPGTRAVGLPEGNTEKALQLMEDAGVEIVADRPLPRLPERAPAVERSARTGIGRISASLVGISV